MCDSENQNLRRKKKISAQILTLCLVRGIWEEKKRKEIEGKEINSFVWLGGTAVKKRKMKETNSSMAHYILSSQIERERRGYLWWDPPIYKVCFPPIFPYKPNKEKKKNYPFSTLSSPLSSPLSLPFPPLPLLFSQTQC